MIEKLVEACPTQTENAYTGIKPPMTPFSYVAVFEDSSELRNPKRASSARRALPSGETA